MIIEYGQILQHHDGVDGMTPTEYEDALLLSVQDKNESGSPENKELAERWRDFAQLKTGPDFKLNMDVFARVWGKYRVKKSPPEENGIVRYPLKVFIPGETNEESPPSSDTSQHPDVGSDHARAAELLLRSMMLAWRMSRDASEFLLDEEEK